MASSWIKWLIIALIAVLPLLFLSNVAAESGCHCTDGNDTKVEAPKR